MKTYLSLDQRAVAYLALLDAFEIPRNKDHSLTAQQTELKGYAELVTFGQETAPTALRAVEALEEFTREYAGKFYALDFESVVAAVGCTDTAVSALRAFGAIMCVKEDGTLIAVDMDVDPADMDELTDVEVPSDLLSRAA